MSEETREARLAALGYSLDQAPGVAAAYVPVVVEQGIAYLSGALPVQGGLTLAFKGTVPDAVSLEEATRAAELCAVNLLRNLHRELGSLDRIQRVLKVTGYVSGRPDFEQQHQVLNGASELLVKVLGDAGRHARAAVGVSGLPLGAPVEVDMLVRVKE